jgi:hypothetical protein
MIQMKDWRLRREEMMDLREIELETEDGRLVHEVELTTAKGGEEGTACERDEWKDWKK